MLATGIACTLVAGITCGLYMLPMRYLGRWSWENLWVVFSPISCVLMPIALTWATVPDFLRVIRLTSPHAAEMACLAGFSWGFGAIMFGQSVSAVGISISNTMVLAISASMGSFIPMLILSPDRLLRPQGKVIVLGTLIGIVGIACSGYAGMLREKSQKNSQENLHRKMVGKARPMGVGLLLCVGAGLGSAVLNIGYSAAQPLVATALRLGYSSFAGSNVIWLLLLVSGSIPNICYGVYLLIRNGSWRKFAVPNSAPLYGLAVLMGVLWAGEIFLYGFASPKIGRLGPSIGWPIKLISGLIAANVAGYLIGEWKLTHPKEQRWMLVGLVVQLAAIVTLGWAGTLD
jgi:L-rhamnose-H+ transport protein